jgi:RimJ/RimL family protein N-acetyltransferase
MSGLILLAINREGVPEGACPELDEVARGVCSQTAALYGSAGFVPPWVCYLALSGDRIVGTCGFTAPPAEGRVEIAYYTFQPFEGRGIATSMARELLALATAADPRVQVIAHTLPERNASTRILEKTGFRLKGAVLHPEDGEIWEWERPSGNAAPNDGR